MRHVTLLARTGRWQLLAGAGDGGTVLGERSNAPRLVDVSFAAVPLLWACTKVAAGRWMVEQLEVPSLCVRQTGEVGWRADAIASSPDGRRVVLLRGDGQDGLWLGPQPGWTLLPCSTSPDAASRLAWIEERRLAFESAQRRLCTLDLESGDLETGPSGAWPAAAPRSGRWFAISAGHPVALPLSPRGALEPQPLAGFDVAHPTSLRASCDGQVLTWTEPRLWFGIDTYVQSSGQQRTRLGRAGDALVAVGGSYEI